MLAYRVRYVSDGGPVRAENKNGWPATCGHTHKMARAAAECAARCVKVANEKKQPLGVGIQYRLMDGEPWHWVSENENKRLLDEAGVPQ